MDLSGEYAQPPGRVAAAMLVTSVVIFVGGIVAGTALLSYVWAILSSGVAGGLSSVLMYQGLDLLLRSRRRYWEESDTWTRLARM